MRLNIMNFAADIASETRLVRDGVYEKLKETILIQRYKPGAHLIEQLLARQFNVSTTPVKNVPGLLKQEVLVVTRNRKGTFVSNNIMNWIEEINLVKAALEGIAARLAATKITEEKIQQLGKVIKMMKRYTKKKETPKIIEINARFHGLIRTFARNNYICKQIESICSVDRRFRKIALSRSGELIGPLKSIV